MSGWYPEKPRRGATRLRSSTTSSGIRMLIVVMGRSFWSRSRSCAIFIEPPFARSDRAGRDDADGLLPEGVDDRQLPPAFRQPDRRLPLFTAQHLGAVEVDERIEEDLKDSREKKKRLPSTAFCVLS